MPKYYQIGLLVSLGLVVTVTSLGCGHAAASTGAERGAGRCYDRLVAANAKIAELKGRISELEQRNATLVARARAGPARRAAPRLAPMETPSSDERGFWLTIENTHTGESKTLYYADR